MNDNVTLPDNLPDSVRSQMSRAEVDEHRSNVALKYQLDRQTEAAEDKALRDDARRKRFYGEDYREVLDNQGSGEPSDNETEDGKMGSVLNSLKSLMKDIEKDLEDSMKVEDKVPEKKTDSLKELLEFTKDEMAKRPTKSPEGKVEKGKKVSKKNVKKSIEELSSLIKSIQLDVLKTQNPNIDEANAPTEPVEFDEDGETGDEVGEGERLALQQGALTPSEAGQGPDARTADLPKNDEDLPF